MSIQLRESTAFVIDCKAVAKRWFWYKFYRSDVYEALSQVVTDPSELRKKKRQNRYLAYNFVVSDDDRALYNTYAHIDPMEIEARGHDNKRSRRQKEIDHVLKQGKNPAVAGT